MRRWHAERELMLRRWRMEIAKHEMWSHARPGYRRYASRMDFAPIPPVACEEDCHCYRGAGFFRKRHPYDCGKSRCHHCHWEKLGQNPRSRDRRRAIEFELSL